MSAPDAAVPARVASSVSARAMWLILAAVVIADALDLLDSTLTNIAAPTIAADLGGGEALIKWLGAAYALAMGVLLVVGGRLGDKYGHRQTFLVGIAGFTLASLVCGLAPDSTVIVIGRLLQGGFGALLIPQGIAIVTTSFTPEMLAKAFSVFGPALGLAAVGGPILGAFILDANIAGLGWRPMFLINIVLGTAGFVLAWKVLPRIPRDKAVFLDGIGAGLLAAAMFCLIYALIYGPANGWSALPVTLAIAGVAFLAGFAWRQQRAANPLIKPSLFQNRGFTAGLVMALAIFSVVAGLSMVISLFLQQGLDRTPVQTAVQAFVPMSVGIIISSIVAAPLIQRLGRRLVLAGLLISLVGEVALWALVREHGKALSHWTLAPALLVLGLGMGTCFGALFDIAVGDIAPDEAGSASGSLSAVQQLAGSMGVAVILSVWFHSSTHNAPSATETCLLIVAAVTAGCCFLVALLPRTAQPEHAEPRNTNVALEEHA
jgi:EmrB/QacA subfamily drug resistance transporter